MNRLRYLAEDTIRAKKQDADNCILFQFYCSVVFPVLHELVGEDTNKGDRKQLPTY